MTGGRRWGESEREREHAEALGRNSVSTGDALVPDQWKKDF